MRSRYSAFVLSQSDYLLATWHTSTRPEDLSFDAGIRWLGLEVKGHWPDGDRAEVEFVARYRQAGRAVRLHERSRFVCEIGLSDQLPRWYYVDGAFPENK
jgi:SEC-C motif-containing protein